VCMQNYGIGIDQQKMFTGVVPTAAADQRFGDKIFTPSLAQQTPFG
jgi:hypothetical protein